MRDAPSVIYPVGRCAFMAWMLGLIGSVGAAVCMMFLHATNVQAFQPRLWPLQVVLVLSWLIWVAWAVRGWFVSPQGALHWQTAQALNEGTVGAAWSWKDRDSAEPLFLLEVERVLDLQDWILLRSRSTKGNQRWFWVERIDSPARWGDLRRALVSSHA